MSGPKSNPIAFVRLHRLHAAPVATRVQFPDPIGQTWRGEGGDRDSKRAIAYRLARKTRCHTEDERGVIPLAEAQIGDLFCSEW